VLYEAAKKLGAGGLSGLLTSDGTLHIIKVKEYTPFKQYSFEESKGFVARRIRQQEQQKRLQEWEVKLKKEAKIEMVPAGGSGEKGH
jgi:parvulin-like peptidyl-prolyl isomerase